VQKTSAPAIGQQALVKRASQQIADELRRLILHGELSEAEGLPPEPELAAQLGVSRHHLREALRLLEQDGLVKVRAGRNGGIFLTVPGVEVLARTFAGILARNNTPLHDLMAARMIIEPAAAEMAAQNATSAEVDALEAILEQQALLDEYSGHANRLNTQFHVALTSAAHNQTLLLMMRSIESIIPTIDTSIRSSDLHAASLRAHRAIVRSLRARDGTQVADLMRRHIAGFEQELRERGVDLATRTVAESLHAATMMFGTAPVSKGKTDAAVHGTAADTRRD
jgi:DNA-binding FadR family transcriptional regulator